MHHRSLFTLLLALFFSAGTIQAQTARLQVVHNSADMAADSVDVWLTVGMMAPAKLLDNFAFRNATPFIDAPAGVPLMIGIAGKNSTTADDTLKNFNVTLMAGESYIAVANGIVSPTGYMPAQPFVLDIFAGAREVSANVGQTDVLVMHGSTDAPTVDVVEVSVPAGTIVDDASYNQFAGYLELGTADYLLQIRTGEGNTTVAEFAAPLSTLGLEDSALVVLASGFLDPSMNSNGPGFGLYAVLPSGGELLPLPTAPISTARVQVIHNSADLAAATVDVWLNDALLLDDFSFRTASPFIDAPAGVDFDVTIQPANSMDTTNGLARFTYNLTGGEKYILVANGIVSPTGYSPATPFNIDVHAGAMERAETAGNASVLVYHGATDAPMVDVEELAVPAGQVVNDLSYSEFQGYLDLGVLDYQLQVQAAANGNAVATYEAPLLTLGLQDQAMTVLASGFLDPSMNSNGPAFGLWVALPTGGPLVELPSALTAISDALDGAEWTLFPNPAQDQVTLRMDLPASGDVSIDILDLQGRVLYQTRTSSVTRDMALDLGNLPAGSYFVRLQTNSGQLMKKLQVTN